MEANSNLLRINKSRCDAILSYCALLQILLALIQDCIINIGVSIDTASKLRVVSSLLLFLGTTLLTFKRKPKIVLISYSAFISILSFSFIIFPQSHEFIFNDAIKYSVISISIVLAIISINDVDIFLKVLTKVSIFGSLIGILYGITWHPALTSDESIYSMSISYNLLLPSMVLFHSKGKLYKLLFIITVLVVVLFGSRGALLFIVTYLLYRILFKSNVSKKIVFFLCVGICLLLLPQIINCLESFDSLSRSVQLILSGSFFSHDSGRTDIYELVLLHIAEAPLFGHGIGADRFYLNGFYAHNIILEMMLQYGIIAGLSLFFILTTFIVVAFLNFRLYRDYTIIFTLSGFLPLMLSGSYLINFNFAATIGYICLLFKSEQHSTKFLNENITYLQ